MSESARRPTTSSAAGCPFCDRIQRGEYDELFGAVARFEPLNPVTPGHMLFVPSLHVEHPNWGAVGNAMNHAELFASGQPWDFNLITSSGRAATQTISHVHVHYVPRREGDGLPLPWTGQRELEVEYGWRKYPDIPVLPVEDEAQARRLTKQQGDVWQRMVSPWQPAGEERKC